MRIVTGQILKKWFGDIDSWQVTIGAWLLAVPYVLFLALIVIKAFITVIRIISCIDRD
jgi:hypothetical protein